MKTITARVYRIVCLAGILALPACSYIKSWFPDKEKEYQYTTEIPELVIPADLKNTPSLALPASSAKADAPIAMPETPEVAAAPLDAPADKPLATATAATDATPTDTANTALPEATEPSSSAPVKREIIVTELVKTAEQTSLRIQTPFGKAWRAVDKALSRKSIEVITRNSEEKQFTVKYDAEGKKLEDSSFWDEAAFIFKGFQGNEKTYTLKLQEMNNQTQLTVLDDQLKATNDAGAAELVTVLHETIKADFAK